MFSRIYIGTIAAFALLLFQISALAQSDTAYYNLGQVKLPKNFTQKVIIKGEDLQKLPFMNLSDVLNVWFNGVYSNSATLVYVVDGNLVTDVNQYSIHDIEDITLIQNAAAQLNGISQQQQLVLITTKRNSEGQSGGKLTAQVGLIQQRPSTRFDMGTVQEVPVSSRSNELYQQYYISGYKNVNQAHFGASVNFLRDILPDYNFGYIQSSTPAVVNRLRFNGYLNTTVWKGSVLDATVGFVPQTGKQAVERAIIRGTTTAITQQDNHLKDHLYNGTLSLTSKIFSALTNTIHAVYNKYYIDYNNSTDFTAIFAGSSSVSTNLKDSTHNQKMFLIYDDLNYQHNIGNWTLSPNLNFKYEYINATADANAISYFNGDLTGTNYLSLEAKLKRIFLTPSVNVRYKNLFNINTGVLYILNSNKQLNFFAQQNLKKLLPYVSFSGDAGQALNISNIMGLKIHVSYALSNSVVNGFPYTVYDNTLTDLTTASIGTNILFNTSIYNPYTYESKLYKALLLGTDIGLFKNKLMVNYNYEKRNNYTTSTVRLLNFTINRDYKVLYNIHRISIGSDIVKLDKFKWKTHLNLSNYKQTLYSNASTGPDNIVLGGKIWTGGWVNRVQYNHVITGVDVLYLKNEPQSTYRGTFVSPVPVPKTQLNSFNSFSLQNVYLGFQLKSPKFKSLDIFLNGRNILVSRNSYITDSRRYFGAGINMSL